MSLEFFAFQSRDDQPVDNPLSVFNSLRMMQSALLGDGDETLRHVNTITTISNAVRNSQPAW
jgi:hypothetical protein